MIAPKFDPHRELSAPDCALYAHTPGATAPGKWHLLPDHLVRVAELAREFASPFGGGSMAYLLGLSHDAGKAIAEVQDALRARNKDGGGVLGVAHKVEGAALAWLLWDAGSHESAHTMLLANYGHHSGIPAHRDAIDILKSMREEPTSLDPLIALLDNATGISLRTAAGQITLPDWTRCTSSLGPLEMFVRMCHSALVDADFLDTQAHFQGLAEPYRSTTFGMDKLRRAFVARYDKKYASAPSSQLSTLRRTIFDKATAAGRATPSTGRMFRLPAPTGTGKTMAAATFALHHAAAFNKRRVVVAVPFTSITTQNAAAYREMFEDLADHIVLEHHSNILDDDLADDSWRRLSAANWDAEFIVTTTVQLFDSLLSNKPSATRRLHRLADSVIVLDEVQALPLDLVPVILEVLRELNEHFGVTVLLASATQPNFWDHEVWRDLDFVDIIPLDATPEVTRRVSYEVRESRQSCATVAAEIASQHQALAIVNTTSDAARFYGEIAGGTSPEVTLLHLSTRMCNVHRLKVLEQMRDLLIRGEPVIVVSTQLIEAGVDVDFPLVYRALAPAEAIVQAAGRCNREGKLDADEARVIVFDPTDGNLPPGAYKSAADITRSLFVNEAARESPLRTVLGEPEPMQRYFARLYQHLYENAFGGRSHDITASRSKLDFPAVAQHFQMITDENLSVVVPQYAPLDEQEQIYEILDRQFAIPGFALNRAQHRLLHKYTASAPPRTRHDHGLVQEVPHGPFVWQGEYDERLGLVLEPRAAVL